MLYFVYRLNFLEHQILHLRYYEYKKVVELFICFDYLCNKEYVSRSVSMNAESTNDISGKTVATL